MTILNMEESDNRSKCKSNKPMIVIFDFEVFVDILFGIGNFTFLQFLLTRFPDEIIANVSTRPAITNWKFLQEVRNKRF